ncbi:MAG: DUF1573 domain-containing protein, partial [Candidatus Delongbacteria bacterium]|nr:DUF1573 domain-containing protein [Candidatus Delongbacteria bacterium]
LPRFAKSVQLSNDKNVTLDYDAGKYVEIKLDHPLLPSRGIMSRSMDISKIPYEISSESITDSWYPGNIVEGTSPFIMRDVRGTSVIVHPFQYNAATQTLRVYKNIAVTLTDNDTKPVNPLITKSSTIVSEMNGMYKGMFINYNETKVMDVGELGEILIVYTSSYGGLTALEPYIQWKEEMGYTVNILQVNYGTDLYVSGDIQDEYDANSNILYVQLVGDWAALKSEYLNSATSTYGSQDPMLGCVVGTDQYMDIIVGRFSVEDDAQVANQINKAINYEKNPEIGGSWYDTCMGIAGDEGPGDDGEIDYEHSENIINGRLLPFTYTTANTVYQSADAYTDAKIIEYVETGTTIINYTGHGSYDCWQSIDGTWFYNDEVLSMTNGNRLPFIQSVACLVGNIYYASSDCFAEAWLRHTNGGAVVGWFSTISQPWYPPMVGQDYFNDILIGGYDYNSNPGSGVIITEQRTHYGSICANASNQMLLDNPTDASTRDTQESWTIFGDVTLQVRTDQPILIDNSTTTLLPSNYTTRITAGGSGVEGARVTLYQNGTNVTGLTNSNGDVSLDHSFAIASDVTVTVTGFNLETEQSVWMVTGDLGGTFSLDNSSLSYGNVTVDGSSTLQFTITNTHNTETIIGDITTITGYTVANAAKNTLSYAVPTNSSKTFDLVFSPTDETSYSGNITITSSDPSHDPEYISVSGTGALPDINLAATTSATAEPDASVSDSFEIQNTGVSGLNYSLSNAYVGFETPPVSAESNDFESGLVYTNSGTISWAIASGLTVNCATVGGSSATGILTSGTFDGTGANELYLDFDHEYTVRSVSNIKVEYYTGSAWVEVYASTAAASGHVRVALPTLAANMQLRFTGVMYRQQGLSSYWSIDNVVVSQDATPYSWLTFNSATTGLVSGGGSNTINLTYDATGLVLGDYEANITVNSDDPDEPSEVIAVTFTVGGTPPTPGIPDIIIHYIVPNMVIDWVVAADATSYDVYSSDDPYGIFTLEANVGTNQYVIPMIEAKMFYYVVAKN